MSELATGPLPPGWISAAIVDLAEVNPRRLNPAYADDVPVVFVPMARVAEESRGMDVQERRPFAKVMRGYSQFQPDDVLFAKITPCMENGKVAVVPGIEPPIGYGSTEFFVLRPRADGISVWIARCVSQARFRRLAQKNMQGAVGQLRVPKVWIENAEVPVAPPAEQRRILRRLDSLFAQLDDGIAALKRAEANLERHRASVLKAAVEGRLTERWRSEKPPHETGEELLRRILAERRKRWEEDQLAAFAAKGRKPPRNWKSRYKEPVGPDTARLPELPEGWCWATVDQVAELVQYGSSSKTSLQADVPVLRMGNIQGGELEVQSLKYLPAGHREFPALLLRDGDLLFNRTNSAELVGKSAVYNGQVSPCSFASYLIRVRLFEGCVPDFLAACLNSLFGRRWAATVVSQQVGQANISGRKLRAFAFPLPPVLEQTRVVAAISRSLSEGRRGKRAAGSALVAAATVRQSILKRAFEGRLVPQEPDDEPVRVLLDRIRTKSQGPLNSTPGSPHGLI